MPDITIESIGTRMSDFATWYGNFVPVAEIPTDEAVNTCLERSMRNRVKIVIREDNENHSEIVTIEGDVEAIRKLMNGRVRFDYYCPMIGTHAFFLTSVKEE